MNSYTIWLERDVYNKRNKKWSREYLKLEDFESKESNLNDLQMKDSNSYWPLITQSVKQYYPDFKVYYYNIAVHEKYITFDFGSHVDFLYITPKGVDLKNVVF